MILGCFAEVQQHHPLHRTPFHLVSSNLHPHIAKFRQFSRQGLRSQTFEGKTVALQTSACWPSFTCSIPAGVAFVTMEARRTSAPQPVVSQIADGGGYFTQFILLGPTGPATASVSLLDDNGTPLGVGQQE